ncbi:uncharacterized protein LOC119600386 [Lucilia sericata]|uniref:uncharacterized protein LOC119600386 n=1 Tax=Lucilia sericata TaxID=13632 RepID=UPI0018A816A8|nr:uncharacterized protein LOC119600386 [Lucilia sericata]
MNPQFISFLLTITLVQGFIYLGLSIWGLVMGKCSHDASHITNQATLFTMDLLYLQGKYCGNSNVSILGISKPVILNLDWTMAEYTKLRTFIVLILYTIISCLWIILSLACLSAVYKSNFKKPVNKCLSALWLLAILGGSIIDGIATAFYAYDIPYTTSAASTFQYLKITVDALTMAYLEEFDVYFTTPALIMTVLTCRVGILWFINIFGCGLCVAAMTRLPIKLKNIEENRTYSNK